MQTYIVRVWVPDRPGALGQVASRIGAVHGDVIGIDILERGAGMAIDELTVALPRSGLVELLASEISEVDGVAIEEIRPVQAARTESGLLALEIAAGLAARHPDDVLESFCFEAIEFLEADWVVALDLDGSNEVLVQKGEAPDADWLGAFVAGSRHLDPAQQHHNAPQDMAWAVLATRDAAVVAGRRTRAFRERERVQFELLGRIVDGLLGPVAGTFDGS